MSHNKRSRVNAKGRNGDRVGSADRVLIIRRSLWQSPRFSCLSPAATTLAIELLSMFNGTNNGNIFLSVRDATGRLGFSDYRPAMDAFQELQDAALISLELAGHFALKAGEVSKAHAWRLHFVDADGKPASDESMRPLDVSRLSEKAQRRMAKRQNVLKRYLRDYQVGKFTVGESTTVDARRVGNTTTDSQAIVGESTAVAVPDRKEVLPPPVGEITSHIAYHIPPAPEELAHLVRRHLSGWWRRATAKERARFARQQELRIDELLDFLEGADVRLETVAKIMSGLVDDRAAA